jgi:hypothetical protein
MPPKRPPLKRTNTKEARHLHTEISDALHEAVCGIRRENKNQLSTIATEALEHDFPTLGIKVSAFKDFMIENGGEVAFSHKAFVKQPLTTTDVCKTFVKPITEEKECSYVDYLKLAKPDTDIVGEATVFISHAWQYAFIDVVHALETYFVDQPDTFVWFDLFSNNQHATFDLSFYWWKNTFLNAIEKIGHVVMILSPWKNPLPLTRAWCLWEIFCAVDTDSKFEVAITPTEYTAFVDGITHNPDDFYLMLSNINVELSQAYSEQDKIRIFKCVKDACGFDALNKMVSKTMRSWALLSINKAIDNIYRFKDISHAFKKNNINEYHKAIDDFDIKKKRILWDRLQAKAILLLDMGNLKDSYNALMLCKKLLGSHVDGKRLGKLYNCLGNIFDEEGKYDNAIEMQEKALKIQIEYLGHDHLDVADTYNNLGVTYSNISNNTNITDTNRKAIDCYEKDLEITLKVLNNKKDPKVAITYGNLASIYCDDENYDKAMKILYYCKKYTKRSITRRTS